MADLDLNDHLECETVLENHLLWSAVLEKLKSGEMPPPG